MTWLKEHTGNNKRKKIKRNECPNQLEDKEQACLRKTNRAIFKANNACLGGAKQNMLGSNQATLGEETTKFRQAKILEDDLSEQQWAKMNEEIKECKRMAWPVQPPPRKRKVERLQMTKIGAEPGRSRTRTSRLNELQSVPEGGHVLWQLSTHVADGNGKQVRDTTSADANVFPLVKERQNSDGTTKTKIRPNRNPGGRKEKGTKKEGNTIMMTIVIMITKLIVIMITIANL